MSPEEKPFFPIWQDREKWYVRTDELGEGLVLLFKPIVDRTREGVRRFLKAFPNPFLMLDEIIQWATGLMGLVLTAPFLVVKYRFLEILKAQKLDSRLIRLDDAVDGFFNAQILTLKQLTFTSETGILYWILGRIGRGVYRTFKKYRLLRRLLQAKSEVEFVETLINTWLKRLRVLSVIGLILGLFAWLVGAAISIFFLSFAVNFGEIYAYILPQDSKRVRGLRKHTQYRVNLKKGPDK